MSKTTYLVTVRGQLPPGIRAKLVGIHVQAVKKRKKKGIKQQPATR